jgi:KipI family sensor histidine kinase inhibitor
MGMTYPRSVPCGDRGLLVYLGAGIEPELNKRVHALAHHLRTLAHPAVTEVTASYHAVLIEYDPVRLRTEALQELVQQALQAGTADLPAGRTVTIPVCYGGEYGPDLDRVAQLTGLSADEVIERHSAGQYLVYAIGFSPGFPYLGGLDASLATPRLAEPRIRVEAGSVGIGGEQTGIYPAPSPGGWNLIGRTPLRLFDPAAPSPSLLEPGDQIRFQPISTSQFAAMQPAPVPPTQPTEQPGQTGLRVLQPGLMTTIQDLGRRGFQRYGVSHSGAVDFWALMVGNWLLGNRARTAALEITLQGPEVEVTGPLAFALTGAAIEAELIPADGSPARPLEGWRSYLAGPGDRIRLGAVLRGCRAYLCIQGGIDLPPVLGSLSEDLFGKIGPLGRPLRAGDWLPVGLALHAPADVAGRALPPEYLPPYDQPANLRFVPGPQPFPPEALAQLAEATYRVSPNSDRQGVRLSGPALPHGPAGADILSEPIAPGSIQVPANGQPILLLGNRQTIAGYAKIGVVIYPDLARAGQLRPGDAVRFTPVTLAEAQAITRAERRRLAAIRRLLERGGALVPDEPSAHGPAPVQPVPPAAPDPVVVQTEVPLRRFRISIGGIEFTADVEEVTE